MPSINNNSSFPQKATLLHKATVVILIGVFSALFIHSLSPEQIPAGSMMKAGDLPAFYIAAKLVTENPEKLYDFKLQHKLENQYWPSLNGEFYVFPYPPFTAVALSPLAYLSITEAKIAFLLVNFFSFLLGAIILSRYREISSSISIPLTLLFLFSCPMGLSIIGNQNSGVTFLLVSTFLIGLNSNSTWWGELLAGASTGLLLYKPQFALFPFLLLIILTQWRALASFSLVAGLLYLVGASVQGPDWPFTWVASANTFGFENFQRNSYHMISLHGVTFSALRFFVVDFESLRPVLSGLNICICIFSLLFALFARKIFRRSNPTDPERLWLLSTIALLSVLLPPQTLFYDLAVGVIGFYLWLIPKTKKTTYLVIGFVAANALLFLFRGDQGFSYYGCAVLIAMAVLLKSRPYKSTPDKSTEEVISLHYAE